MEFQETINKYFRVSLDTSRDSSEIWNVNISNVFTQAT